MTELESLIPKPETVTTVSGKTYELPRPSIYIRKKTLEFIRTAKSLRDRVQGGDVDEDGAIDLSIELCDKLVDLLEIWLQRDYPDITRDQIERDFDVQDVPAVMAAINVFEQELLNVVPPAGSPNRETRRSARKKPSPTGGKSRRT